jgi:FeS assembly SUF system protein
MADTTDITQGIEHSPEDLEQLVVDVLKTCYDPEIPVNIYELGLVYGIDIQPGNIVHVVMTLTAPSCPVAGSLPGQIEEKLRATPGINDARVHVTWEPPWTMSMMTDEAKLTLGMM